ncbi:MAG TPA: hypothetical protein VIK81_00550 [Patescibacteria group bacterium]
MVEVNQKVKVMTFFDTGKIFPVKMRWNKRIINFKKLVFSSSRRNGLEKIHSFIMESDSAIYEIEFSNESFRWILKKLQPMDLAQN